VVVSTGPWPRLPPAGPASDRAAVSTLVVAIAMTTALTVNSTA
jgi:hypothetical protein